MGAATPTDPVEFCRRFPHDRTLFTSEGGLAHEGSKMKGNSAFSLTTLPEHPLVMAQGNVKWLR